MNHLIEKFLHQRDNLPTFKCFLELKVDLERDDCPMKTNRIINSEEKICFAQTFCNLEIRMKISM